VIVMPVVPELIAVATSAGVAPAGHDQVMPLPVQAAYAETEPNAKISPTRRAILRIIIPRLYGFWNNTRNHTKVAVPPFAGIWNACRQRAIDLLLISHSVSEMNVQSFEACNSPGILELRPQELFSDSPNPLRRSAFPPYSGFGSSEELVDANLRSYHFALSSRIRASSASGTRLLIGRCKRSCNASLPISVSGT
jgi:hypothetical protein